MSKMPKITIAAKIEAAHIECERLNPHFTPEQSRDWVYQSVFGAFTGSEADRRNLALCA